MRRMVVIALDHPVQHFAPAFRQLAASERVKAVALYGRTGEGGIHDPDFARTVEWDVPLLSGYSWWAPPACSGSLGTKVAILRQLERLQPELVLCFGWATPVARVAMAWALARRRKLLLYGDSTWQHERTSARGLVRSALLRPLFAVSSGAVSTGTFNREFYIRHGMHPAAIAKGVYPADIALYAKAREGRRPMGNGPLAVGFAGKLIPRKGVDELLSAMALLPPATATASIAGDGPELDRLRVFAEELSLGDRVAFLGFRNQSEMPSFLSSCDVVVVPSREDMRVLIILEAIAAGAAVVVSSATAVWGAGDLVDHGVTGLVYPSGDPGALAACLRSLAADRRRVAALASAASERLDAYGPAAFRRHVEDAVVGLFD